MGLAVLLVVTGCSAAGSGGPDSPDLSEEFGCGYGFYLSNTDQTEGLFLTYTDFEGAQAGNVVEVSSLPGGSWQGEYQVGTDLFANWCDDVIEPGEPEPVVEGTWRVSGTVTIDELPAAGQCGPATATLTGMAARNGDGEVISLGDLQVENEAWGCFAG